MLAFLLLPQCKQLLKVQPRSYLHMKLTYETQGCVFVHVSYLFLHSVILIDGILVFRSSDAEQRGQSLSHVVTHYRTHKHSIKIMMKVPKNNQIQLVWNKLWNTLECIPVKHLIRAYCLTVKYPASVTCFSHKCLIVTPEGSLWKWFVYRFIYQYWNFILPYTGIVFGPRKRVSVTVNC